jgi:hypothetical protein
VDPHVRTKIPRTCFITERAQLFVLVLVAHLTAEEETVNGGRRTPSPGDTAAREQEQREVGGGILDSDHSPATAGTFPSSLPPHMLRVRVRDFGGLAVGDELAGCSSLILIRFTSSVLL